MVGVRRQEYYIQKFGEELGIEKYNNLLKSRDHREKIQNSNRSLSSEINKKLKNWNDKEKEENVLNGNLVKCKECDSYKTRLQWTHFKYKCTGRFNNGVEYKAVYPDDLLVSPNLGKLTSMTKDAMISLYGKELGLEKWNNYCEKQSETNTFEYKAEKYGYIQKDFDEFNKSRAVTIENLIKKHGEELGLKKWDNYCDRQRYTCSLEYFIKEYGKEEGTSKYESWVKIKSFKLYKGGISPLELLVFNELKMDIKTLQHQIILKGQSKYGCFDMGCHIKNKVIEFNGDYWHANPMIYENNDLINFPGRPLKNVNDIWKKDNDKNNMAHQLGYDVYVIWELDWNKNKLQVIENVIKWWNER